MLIPQLLLNAPTWIDCRCAAFSCTPRPPLIQTHASTSLQYVPIDNSIKDSEFPLLFKTRCSFQLIQNRIYLYNRKLSLSKTVREEYWFGVISDYESESIGQSCWIKDV
ncbi:hypothetical protein GOODEAATRI_021347 [Goodea atripinnis]|uniref:Uncharacterized protein n=1 Tax=Goodea atripinnis TaxID=208336 RepID=A0ABV0MTX9_9TELE